MLHKNLRRTYLISILLLTICIGANGQELSKAELIDEFGRMPCGDWRARIDMFLQTVSSQNRMKGIVVTSAASDHKLASILREEMVRAQARDRRFPMSRIEFYRTITEDEPNTQFWLMPEGDKFEAKNRDDSYSLRVVLKPFPLLYDDETNEGECADIDEPQLLAKILKDNVGSRLNVVVRATTPRAVERKKQSLKAAFIRNGIGMKRVRVFTKVHRYDPENPLPTEYWYLPVK